MKVDLHCHSLYSNRPSDWFLQKIGTSESYTTVDYLYQTQKQNGMDLVTITDHNVIDGCLELVDKHPEDTFISCEYTTYFPQDRCKFHVLCWNITKEQHSEISKVRENIYDLVTFLRAENIAHGLAHPLFSVNGRLTVSNFEEVIQLFDVFELNSAKDAFSNQYLELILSKAKKNYTLTSGSDDHSGLTLSRGYTVINGAHSVGEFFKLLSLGKSEVHCEGSTPHTLARHIYSIALQWLQSSNKIETYPEILQTYLLPSHELVKQTLSSKIINKFSSNKPKFWSKNIFFYFLSLKIRDVDLKVTTDLPISQQFFKIIETATDQYISDLVQDVTNNITNNTMIDLFKNSGIIIFLYLLLSPYLIGFSIFGAQRKLGRSILRDFVDDELRPIKVAKFTDNFGTIDGVSKTLEDQLQEANNSGKDYTVISCVGNDLKSCNGFKFFEPVKVFGAPEFSEQPICWPPLLKILDYCYEQQFTHIHTATPGPMGLIAMLVAHTLGLPLYSTYHTQIPQFIGELTEDGFLEDIAWRYIVWFYSNCKTVFSPSEDTRQDLIAHGLDSGIIKVYPRGVDIEKFNPSRRDRIWLKETYGVAEDTKVFIYVGRISKEKNLHTSAMAYKQLCTKNNRNHVFMYVGGGDYLESLRKLTAGLPVIYTGPLEGEPLYKVFASADVFIFPSMRDTHGRVVLEAAASGLPIVVSTQGGPRENVVEGKTGYIIDMTDSSTLLRTMENMLEKDLTQLRVNARRLAEDKFSFQASFEQYWQMYEI